MKVGGGGRRLLFCTHTVLMFLEKVKKSFGVRRSKQFLYRSRQALSLPGGLNFQVSIQSALEGDKFVSPMHRPTLPPGNTPGTLFFSRRSRTQGHSVAVNKNPNSNPRPSGL
jgi:hypothetical protein